MNLCPDICEPVYFLLCQVGAKLGFCVASDRIGSAKPIRRQFYLPHHITYKSLYESPGDAPAPLMERGSPSAMPACLCNLIQLPPSSHHIQEFIWIAWRCSCSAPRLSIGGARPLVQADPTIRTSVQVTWEHLETRVQVT